VVLVSWTVELAQPDATPALSRDVLDAAVRRACATKSRIVAQPSGRLSARFFAQTIAARRRMVVRPPPSRSVADVDVNHAFARKTHHVAAMPGGQLASLFAHWNATDPAVTFVEMVSALTMARHVKAALKTAECVVMGAPCQPLRDVMDVIVRHACVNWHPHVARIPGLNYV